MIPERPDAAWVQTLKAGDRVAVAENRRQIYVGIVLRKTPGGLLKVVPESDRQRSLLCARVFWGAHERAHRIGWLRGDGFLSLYLVPVESAP